MSAASDIRDRFDASWEAFRTSADAADLDSPTASGWTRKEMVSHVAFWLETVEPFVTGMYRGDPSAFGHTFASGYQAGGEWPDADVHNAREAAWARDRRADEVRARLDAAAARVRGFLASVTDDEAAEHADYFTEVPGHLDQHLPELRG